MVEGRRRSVGGEGRGRTRGEKGGRRGRTAVSCWTHRSSRQQQTHPPTLPGTQSLPTESAAPAFWSTSPTCGIPVSPDPPQLRLLSVTQRPAALCKPETHRGQKLPSASVFPGDLRQGGCIIPGHTHRCPHSIWSESFPKNSKPPTQKYSPALSRPPCDSHVMPCPALSKSRYRADHKWVRSQCDQGGEQVHTNAGVKPNRPNNQRRE